VIESTIEQYDRKNNQGFWRILLYRESKRTKQVLISVVITDNHPISEDLSNKIKE
jgi:hypothetical protein